MSGGMNELSKKSSLTQGGRPGPFQNIFSKLMRLDAEKGRLLREIRHIRGWGEPDFSVVGSGLNSKYLKRAK